MSDDRIIVALDTAERAEVERLCAVLTGKVRTLKVGLGLFVAEGPPILDDIRDAGFEVFLDLKLHDIPHQVGLACADIARMGVSMFTVHTAGGADMLSAAVTTTREVAREQGAPAPKIVGVTVLTSLSEQDVHTLGIARGLADQSAALARLALDTGLDGIVASPREVSRLRRLFGSDFIAVAPGIRPAGAMRDDQKRAMTPREALDAGASYLVIGRPITSSPDPAAALASIEQELD